MPEDRRLAAIMFTDIVGYTKLMGEDEDKAFEILKINREIHTLQLSKYGGTFIKEMGDGILASFPSPLNSINPKGLVLLHRMKAVKTSSCISRQLNVLEWGRWTKACVLLSRRSPTRAERVRRQ